MKNNRKHRGHLKVGKLLVCLLMAIAVIVAAVLLLGKGISAIKTHTTAAADTPPVYTLLIGSDPAYGSQADVVILAARNEGKKELTLLSLPSNTRVTPKDDKKNILLRDTYAEGSAEEVKSAVENLLHIRIQNYAVINTENFLSYSKKLGHVDFFVEKDMAHSDGEGNPDISLREGYQTLSGEEALGYLRYVDKENGEIGRVQRQERLLKAFIEKGKTRWPVYAWWLGREYWTAQETDITPSDAASLLYHLRDYTPDNIHFLILPGETEKIDRVDTWMVNPVEVQKAVAVTME